MRTILFTTFFVVLAALSFPIGKDRHNKNDIIKEYLTNDTELVYEQMNLEGIVDFIFWTSSSVWIGDIV